jgi:hypothetical protein
MFNFIMDKLKDRYPTRNYNRAIELPNKDPDVDETDISECNKEIYITCKRD